MTPRVVWYELLTVTCVLIATVTSAQLDEAGRLRVPEGKTRLRYAYGRPDGGGYDTYFIVHEVDTTFLKKTPEWNPNDGKPVPLPVHRAVSIAGQWWNTKSGVDIPFSLGSIKLRKTWYDWRRDPDRWFYEVNFEGLFNPIMILMDGTVVPTTIVDLEKRTNKEPANKNLEHISDSANAV